MNAELISVGTEILLGQIVNTNAAWLAQRLADFGINVYRQNTVGDNAARLTACIRESMTRADILILTGGLGPTDDDLTREAVAEATGRELVMDEVQLNWLINRFQTRHGKMTENNRKQALKPAGSLILENPNGTACGYAVPYLDKWLFMLPGPPWEMDAMFENQVVPLLKKLYNLEQHLFSRNLKFFGIGESQLETEVLDLMRSQVDPSMALYASLGETKMRLTTRAANRDVADIKFDALSVEINKRVGKHIYGTDEDTIFSAAANLLLNNGATLATAESCSGGLLASSFTDIPGSSGFFRQGWITYSNESKMQQLQVSAETLANFGAVSEETVREMAEHARAISATDYALSVSGVAGPGGGTAEKPVGLVWLAVASRSETIVKQLNLSGFRSQIKMRTVKNAAFLLWETLKQIEEQKVDYLNV